MRVGESIRAPASQGNIAVLARWRAYPLGAGSGKGADQPRARHARLDDIVDVAAAGSLPRAGEEVFVLGDQFRRRAAGASALASSRRNTRSTAASGPITAISAVGQATAKSAPMCFEFMTT